MKRFISILSLIIVLAMSVSLIGCGGGKETSSKDVEGEYNLGGQEIVIVCFWKDVPDDPGPSMSSQRWYERYKSLEEKYNCVFTCNVMVESEIAAQFEAANLANEKFGDIIFFRMHEAKKYQKDGVLYDISKIFDMDAEYLNKDVTKLFTDPETGGVYAFSSNDSAQKSFILFNIDIFDRYGIEHPYKYVEEGTWTPEKFLEIATRATNDAEGVKGFYAITHDPTASYFLHGFGGSIVYVDENGLYQSGLLKPETIEGLNFLRDMNVKHKVTHIPELGVQWTDPIEQFKAGRVAMVSGADHHLNDLSATMEDRYGIVPYPKKDGIETWANMHESHIVRVIQSNLDDEYAKILGHIYGEYMEPLATPDEQEELNRDKFETQCKDEKSVEMLMMLNDIPLYVIPQLLASPTVYYGLVYSDIEQALRGEKDLMTVLEADHPIFQAEIDATNKGEDYDFTPEWEQEEGEE